MAEVMNLSSASAFADYLVRTYNADLDRLESMAAWLAEQSRQAPGGAGAAGSLHSCFAGAQSRTADIAAKAAELAEHLGQQLAVRDAVEAAGGNALGKDALTPRT